ncbi:MAG: DUF1566 domain-containing protein [Candidatus Gracilibacteria bacterium]|nr:DUF1566 domain-containing protein [Candidatus Gracilibacteria bacterium]
MKTNNTNKISLKKNIYGFTLVELIVVITILVILGTVAFTSLTGYSGSARDSSRVSDVSNISKGLDITYIKMGTYPNPDNSFSVTYSGGVLWTQGTVGERVINTIGAGGGVKVSKNPTDPLATTKEYTYSKLAFGNAYQIKADWEGESISLNSRLIPQTYADAGNPTLSYIKGNYNGITTKTQTGDLIYLLALPSIITSQSGVTSFDQLINKILIHGQTNSGGIAYTPKLVYSSGSLPSTNAEKILFASGIANAYYENVGLSANPAIQSFVAARGNTEALASLGEKLVSTSLGGSANMTPPPPTIYACTGSLIIVNANISNTTELIVNTPYQTTVSGNACYYTCKTNYSGMNCQTYTAPESTYAISACPTVNAARNDATPTKTQILASITDYIGCTVSGITGGIIAGYTYSGSILLANRMVLVTETTNTAGASTTPWGGTMSDIGSTTDNVGALSSMSGSIYGWDGLRNTNAIIGVQGAGSYYAAQKCNAKGTGWYLPANEELNELYCYSNQTATGDSFYGTHANCVAKGYITANIGTLPNFIANYYQSSTEYNGDIVWVQSFDNGYRDTNGKASPYAVRCVKRF